MIQIVIVGIVADPIEFYDGSDAKAVKEELLGGFGKGVLKRRLNDGKYVGVLSATLEAGEYAYHVTAQGTAQPTKNVPDFIQYLESTIVGEPSPIQVDQQYLRAGFEEGKAAGDGGIAGPRWLKKDLPVVAAVLPSSHGDEPIWNVNLGFPLPNPFLDAMLEHCNKSNKGGLEMRNYYDPTVNGFKPDHYLILGSSGCGKTALGLSLSDKNFLVFLEVPSERTGGEEPVWGFTMPYRNWRNNQSEDEVHAALYANIVSRLVVLKHVLQHRPELTPTQWLLYCFSEEGAMTIRAVHKILCIEWDAVKMSSLYFDLTIDYLQAALKKLLVERYPRRLPLILMVDELQELGSHQLADGKSVIEAVVLAATSLPFPTVWSGTRVGVTAGKSDISGIAKVYMGQVGLKVLCDFEYLSADSVRKKLSEVLDFSPISEDVKLRLGYLLQGRARMTATFVQVLLNRKHYPGKSWPKVLTDEMLESAVEKLFEGLVVPSYGRELERTCGDTGHRRGRADVGEVWAFNMLPPTVDTLEAAMFDRRNSLSFTHSVNKVKNSPLPPSEAVMQQNPKMNDKTEYLFTYQFGEPGLQEALLRYIRDPDEDRSDIAMAGIQKYLLSQDSPSGLGACCDRALALSLLVRRESILRTMLSTHPGLRTYQDYEFTVKRVVEVNSKQQLEWFQLVNNDVMANTFSLMPGIPVRDILILPSPRSGADVIGVATPPRAGPAAKAEGKGVPAGAPGGTETAFSYATRSQAKRARLQGSVSECARVPRLFVQVCSALYESMVPTGKVQDQMRKCAEQFAAGEGGAAAKEYSDLECELLDNGQIAHLSILSELPTSSYIYSAEEKNKFVRMRREEVVDWKLFSWDLMNQIGQQKGQQASVGEKRETTEDTFGIV